MPHTTSNIGPIVFVRWREEIFVTDVLSVEAEIKKLRARAGETLTVLWIVSADVKLMSDDVRLALGRTVHALKHVLRQIHVIVEGTTFFARPTAASSPPRACRAAPAPRWRSTTRCSSAWSTSPRPTTSISAPAAALGETLNAERP